MAQRKSTSRPKRDPGRGPAVLTTARIVASLLMLALIAAGAVLGLPRLRADASYRIRHDDGIAILFSFPTDEPGGQTWFKDEFATQLHRIAAEQISEHPDVLSREQLDAVRDALAHTGWFEGGAVVTRARGAIHISGQWRVPAAVVSHDGREYLIAWGGHLLPKSYAEGEAYARDGVRVISGVAFGPPADEQHRLRYGRRWPGKDLRAALELLALLQDRAYFDQVAGIALSQRAAPAEGLTLTITTPEGTRVVWGGPPNESGVHRGEVSRDRKLSNLDALVRRFGRIDAGRELVEVFGADAGFEAEGGG